MSGWPRWWIRLSLRKAKVSSPKPSTGPDDGRGRASIAPLIIRYATAHRPEAATGGSPPDAHPAALRSHALRRRHAPVRGAADGGQDDPAAPRRHARRLEHVHGVLPGRAPRGLRLCPRHHRMARHPPTDDPAPGAARRPARRPAPRHRREPPARRRGQSRAGRARPALALGGPALLRGERDRAARCSTGSRTPVIGRRATPISSMPRAISGACSRC